MKKIMYLFAFISLVNVNLFAFSSVVQDLLKEVDKGQMLFYCSSSSQLSQRLPALIETFNSLKEKAQALSSSESAKDYVIMRIDYVLATLYEEESANHKDKRSFNLLAYYLPLAKEYLQDETKTSEEKRILSDILLRVVRCLSFGKMVDIAGKSKELLNQAIEKDPDNIYALLARGQMYLFTPRIAGGSLKCAKELLMRSEKLSQTKKDSCGIFLSHLWLSQWAMKQKDEEVYAEYMQKLKESSYAQSWLIDEAKRCNNKGKLLDI